MKKFLVIFMTIFLMACMTQSVEARKADPRYTWLWGYKATWSQCGHIDYTIKGSSYEGSTSDIRWALDQMHTATGYSFVRDDVSPEIIIKWSTPEANSQLDGYLGWTVNSGPAISSKITGSKILIDKNLVSYSIKGRAVVLHELGHSMGLGHVSDSTQVMYSDILWPYDKSLGAGDLLGLSKAGIQPGEC